MSDSQRPGSSAGAPADATGGQDITAVVQEMLTAMVSRRSFQPAAFSVPLLAADDFSCVGQLMCAAIQVSDDVQPDHWKKSASQTATRCILSFLAPFTSLHWGAAASMPSSCARWIAY